MVFLIISILLTWLLLKLKRFFSKTEEKNDKQGIWKLLLWVICSVKNLFSTLWIKFSNNPSISLAEKFYKFLLSWGRFSGLKHTVSETPKEYGIRPGNRFPQIEKEIRLIIYVHDEAIYGFTSPDSHQISLVRLALIRICSPLLWFTRIKSLCFQNRIWDAQTMGPFFILNKDKGFELSVEELRLG